MTYARELSEMLMAGVDVRRRCFQQAELEEVIGVILRRAAARIEELPVIGIATVPYLAGLRAARAAVLALAEEG